MPAARILLVANRTATDRPLIEAVEHRVAAGPTSFHLLVPATPSGLHRVVDPEVAGRRSARERLSLALVTLTEAAGGPVTGHVGDANPLAAIQDALHLHGYDEIILSTLPWRLSRWLRLDLPRKAADLGVPVTVVGPGAAQATAPEGAAEAPEGAIAHVA